MNGTVRGSAGADTITVDDGGSVGGSGTLEGQTEEDTFDLHGPLAGKIRAGQGNDRIHLFSGSGVTAGGGDIRGALGDDTIIADQNALVAGLTQGSEGKDTLTVDRVEPGGQVQGNDDNDTLTVADNAGTVSGGNGDDEIHVRENTGTVDGGEGTDSCDVVGTPPTGCES